MTIKKIPSLNGLRAISILIVIICHLSLYIDSINNYNSINWIKPFIEFIKDGQMAVNIFFVISGYLITTLLENEEIKNVKISIKNFYIRRILRIFPAYYFMLGVYFILQCLHLIKIPAEAWLTAITYTKYFNWEVDWYTGHAWSLSIEEHFYLIWPLLFILGKKTRKISAIVLIFLAPTFRLLDYYYDISFIDELTIFLRIDSIAIGCLFAIYKNKIISILQVRWQFAFYTSLFLLFFLRYLQNIQIDFINPFGYTNGTFGCISISVIMMYSIYGPQNYWFKLLNLKPIDFIGRLSYSLYLWQQMFIYNSRHWTTHLPYNILIIFAMALFSYYLIEKPFLKLKDKII